ncbi:hypothetical protein [Dankookia rubra]|uniref:hypothetical protein n=1 Tax=Dankookia rubra TaxID=1442381 RepID=UPI0010584B03|nr:hypothetical protein [Dankookia rubra]
MSVGARPIRGTRPVSAIRLRSDSSDTIAAPSEAHGFGHSTRGDPVSGSANEQAWGRAFEATYAAVSQRKQQRRQRHRTRTQGPSAETIAAQAARLTAARAHVEICFAKAQPTSDAAELRSFIAFQAKAVDPNARLLWRADAEPVSAELQQARHVAQREEVRQRLSGGHHWPGGPVGDNPAYARASFVYRGLVSDERPILKLIVASTPRAARLRTGDT